MSFETPEPDRFERPANPFAGGQGLPLYVRIASREVCGDDGSLDATRFMSVLTKRTPEKVRAIQARLQELTQVAALPKTDAMALVVEELKEEKPWK